MKRPYQFAIRAQDDGAYDIHIRGVIGEYVDYERWTISDTEQDVLNELKQIPAGKKIHVHVNGPGGLIGLALGIYNGLRTRSQDITTYNDGYALSAHSIVMLAGCKRVSPTGSIWMIHRAQGGADGTGDDMRSMSEGLDVLDGMMAKVYAEVSGKKTAEEFAEMMKKTTWFDGEKAVELGLATDCKGELPENEAADGDVDDDASTAEFKRQFLAQFEKTIPNKLRARVCGRLKPGPAPAPRAQGGQLPANNNNNQKKSMKLIIAALCAAGFSLSAEAEESAVLPHVNSLISDRAKFKAENEKHETALKTRVTAKVEKAISDKLIKAERKDALIKAGLADESTLDFIDDIRAEQATHRPRGVVPARREAGADDVEGQITDLAPRIAGAETAEERGELVAQSIKLRGLDQLFTKKTAVRGNGN